MRWMAVFAFLLIQPAMAATQMACPPLGAMPGYDPEAAELKPYQSVEFRQKIAGSDEVETVTVAGASCRVVYNLHSGRDPLSDLEIAMNYQQQLEALGAEVTPTATRGLNARLVRNGVETWFLVTSSETVIEQRVVTKQPPKVTLLAPTATDVRLLGRMPAYHGGKPVIRGFDQAEFKVADGDDTKLVKVQGRLTRVEYAPTSNAVAATAEEIQFNYRDALSRLGAEILFANDTILTARVISNNQVVWMSIEGQDSGILIIAVEEKPFEPTVKPAPDALKASLDKTGRATLYINFDFGKATLRPEAAPVVAQVLGLMKSDPALRLSIEGHTDNLGSAPLNQTLSRDRAAALVAALIAQGIAPARLQSAGYGLDRPMATNDTSDGRARNRRVELVKQ